MEIRVNSLKDKIAIKSLQRALKCLGISLDDFCVTKKLVDENRQLILENNELKKDPVKKAREEAAAQMFRDCIKGPTTIVNQRKNDSLIKNEETLK